MIRTTRPHVPETKTPTLAQQQADFTAEGAPPPGKVATSPPLSVREKHKPRAVRNRQGEPRA